MDKPDYITSTGPAVLASDARWLVRDGQHAQADGHYADLGGAFVVIGQRLQDDGDTNAVSTPLMYDPAALAALDALVARCDREGL